MSSSGASEDAERARLPRYNEVGQSEAPQGSEILPRWGKMSVPAKAQTRQDPLLHCVRKSVGTLGMKPYRHCLFWRLKELPYGFKDKLYFFIMISALLLQLIYLYG